MPWRDLLRPASFRGAGFFVDGSRGDGGRRGPLHEYPLRDTPFFEDLGRRARSWRINGYVLGPDYTAGRDRLIAACEAVGPGTLVLPVYGSHRVVCRDISWSEAREEGGICRFTFTFVESGEQRFPAGVPDTRAQVRAAAASALAAVRAVFAGRFSLSGVAGFVGNEAAAVVGDIADAVDDLRGLIDGSAALTGDAPAALDGYLAGLRADPLSLVTGGADGVSGQVAGTVEAFRRAGGGDGALAEVARASASWGAVAETTASRVRQAANQSALAGLLRQVSAIERARQAAVETYASKDDALVRRDAVAAAVESGMIAVADAAGAGIPEDAAYDALSDLRARVIADLDARGAALSSIADYRVPRGLPSLALAWRLSGSVADADALAARNPVAHPGFMPPAGQFLGG